MLITKRILASFFDIILMLSLIALIPFFSEDNGVIYLQITKLILYFAAITVQMMLFLSSKGWTPGKYIFGLKVISVAPGAQSLSLKQCFLRPLFSIFGGCLFGPGLKASALLRSDSRHWYDLYLQTQVVSVKGSLHLGAAPISATRKIFAWILILGLTGFFVMNHLQSAKDLSVGGGFIMWHKK